MARPGVRHGFVTLSAAKCGQRHLLVLVHVLFSADSGISRRHQTKPLKSTAVLSLGFRGCRQLTVHQASDSEKPGMIYFASLRRANGGQSTNILQITRKSSEANRLGAGLIWWSRRGSNP